MCIAAIRSCGFNNEVGVITFSILSDESFWMEETQELNEMFISKAISMIKMGGMEKHLSCITMCRCVKQIEGRTTNYWMINCIARIQCGLLLTFDEKHELLRAISRRIVTANYFVKQKCPKFVSAKEEQGYVFGDSGLMVKDHVSLRLALKTMSFTVSHTRVPRNVSFSRCQALMVKPSKWMVIANVSVKTANRSSVVTQPIFYRDDAQNMCPREYWHVLQQGICYMPAVRENSLNGQEQWVFHIHTGYFDASNCNCKSICSSCAKYQPIPLFQMAQLSVLKNLFLKRRAHVLNKRSSPFF